MSGVGQKTDSSGLPPDMREEAREFKNFIALMDKVGKMQEKVAQSCSFVTSESAVKNAGAPKSVGRKEWEKHVNVIHSALSDEDFALSFPAHCNQINSILGKLEECGMISSYAL